MLTTIKAISDVVPFFFFSFINQSYLVWGGSTGWIGGMIVTLLKEAGKEVHCATSRLENRTDIERYGGGISLFFKFDLLCYHIIVLREINEKKPKYVINCAGVVSCTRRFYYFHVFFSMYDQQLRQIDR